MAGGEHAGSVSLVGAGPGDPGLVTVRAMELLRDCDAVVYDALVNPTILTRALGGRERDAEMHFVGKRGGDGEVSARQEDIHRLLVELAAQGKRVVRLKGGDPMVFGRGGEEAQMLAAAGIPFEIVPGITAGVAAPAYAGIPVTHRGVSTSVTFVTGHEDAAREESVTDWAALARSGGTLVLYMGVKRLVAVAEALVQAGTAPDTPVALIEWGTYPRQRTVVAPLHTIAARAREEGIAAPAIAVVGDVVRLRDEIAWFDRRPLFGRRVVVTRARAQASEMAERLAALGAHVIEAPAIRIEPLDAAPLRATLRALSDYRWVIFTSQNAVVLVWDELRALGLDGRAFAGAGVAAIGPATAAALLDRGIAADVRPERFVAEGLAKALAGRTDVRDARVLLATAAGARDVLARELRAMGTRVDVVEVYRSVPESSGVAALCAALERGEIDLITFTSGSTVRFFTEAVGVERARRARAVSIGPITSDAARELGIEVVAEAGEATVDALIAAVQRVLSPPPR